MTENSTPFPAAITLRDYSTSVGTTPVQVLAPGQLGPGIRFLRLCNYLQTASGTANGTIWFSRSGTAAVGQPGSYPLPAGCEEKWDGNFVPVNALSAVGTVPGLLLVVEAG